MVQLGSLRQLTLGSFVLALIPLIALLWQSQSDLAKVGQMTTLETRFVVDVVSDMQRLDNAVVDVERSIRQFAVLRNERVAQLSDNAIDQFAMLVSVSLLLILMGSQLIVNPVNNLKKIIRIMAHSDGQLPPLSRQAPKELIDVEKDLHWLYDRLQQLEHIRTALLRHAAHELKTPLASIKEGCSLLSENVVGELNNSQREVLSLLTGSTQRLNTLVEKLLDYNLLLQQAQPKIVESDAGKLVTACLDDYALAIQEREVDVNISAPTVHVDEELFRRILDNLVSNAVAHGAVGRPINISLYNENDNLVLDVANRGKRIAPESVHTLFEPFIRGTEPRNDNVIGTGLGLSIVADCARLMHGDVKVVDVDYADVCFRVTIPRQEK